MERAEKKNLFVDQIFRANAFENAPRFYLIFSIFSACNDLKMSQENSVVFISSPSDLKNLQ